MEPTIDLLVLVSIHTVTIVFCWRKIGRLNHTGKFDRTDRKVYSTPLASPVSDAKQRTNEAQTGLELVVLPFWIRF